MVAGVVSRRKKINGKITCAKFLRIGRVRKKITKNNASSDLEFF